MTTLSVELNKSNPTNFELTFPLIPGQTEIGASNELILNIHGAVLPAISIPEIERNWQNTKGKIAGGPVEFEIMQVQFIVDAQFLNWRLLRNWMMYISNNKDKMNEHYANYVVDSTLRIIDNFNNDVIGISFVGMWPMNLQEVSFSMKEGEIMLEGGATFTYDYFTVKENI